MAEKKQLFATEIQVLEKYQALSVKPEATKEEIDVALKDLCEHYEELLDQSKLITKVSDKLQNKLNTLNEALGQKNIELQLTIDELTKARMSKKAATYTLLLAVLLFFISEGVLDPIVEAFTSIVWVTMAVKASLALLLKPIEGVIEKYLIKVAMKKTAEVALAAV